jgi:hypothetical protein
MTRTLTGFITVVVAAGLLGGCSSSNSTASPSEDSGRPDSPSAEAGTCTLGKTVACTCSGGKVAGHRECNSAGDGYGACTGCPGGDASPPADAADAHPSRDGSVDSPEKEDSSKEDASKQDAAKEDAPKQDASKEDAAKPDAAKGDAAESDAAKVDAPEQDATKPDAPRDVTVADSLPPKDAAADVTVADTSPPKDASGKDAAEEAGCVEFDQSCEGNQPVICNGSGVWTDNGTCSDATPVCLGGNCVACTPGSTECAGNAGGGLGTGTALCSNAGAWEGEVACPSATPACTLVGGAPTCVCPDGYDTCGTACVNEQTDNNNCGKCTNTCDTAAGVSCQGGTCVPTWTYLFNSYLAAGTIGDCADSNCHGVGGAEDSNCDSPGDCWSFIGQPGFYGLSAGGDLFSWDDGTMPAATSDPGSEPQADADFAAWVAAGSLNN